MSDERCAWVPDVQPCDGERDDWRHLRCAPERNSAPCPDPCPAMPGCHPFRPAPTPPTDEALRAHRERNGMTLRAAAPRLGIDFTYLSKVETGHERPSDALVRKMGALYGFDAEAWVMDRAADEVPEPIRARILAGMHAHQVGDDPMNCAYCGAALPVSLDVEALAEALHDQGFGCNSYRCSIGRGSSPEKHRQDAAFFAAALAAARPAPLDAAWAEVERLLPAGWRWEDMTYQPADGAWIVCVFNETGVGRYRQCAEGVSLHLALTNLAAALARRGSEG